MIQIKDKEIEELESALKEKNGIAICLTLVIHCVM